MFKALLVSAGTVFCLTLPALAHTTISESNIESGATISEVPESLSFAFGGKVGLAAVDLKTEDGAVIALDYVAPKSMEKEFVVPLPELEPAAYTFSWRAVSTDGHVMTGDIPFTVAD